MIELKKLTKLYNTNGSVAVGVQDIDLKLDLNEVVVIVGDSGAGKTTLMNVISGVDTYEEGEMLIDGKSTSDFTNEDFDNYRNNNVGFIFQNYNLIENYSVLYNVMAPLLAKGNSYRESKIRAKELIAEVGLSHRMKTRANKLSGGEKQRTVIARALATDSKILACDEPTGNLDSITSQQIIELIGKLCHDKLVLIVTHDYDSFKDIATRKITMRDGHIIEDEVLKQIEKKEEGGISLQRNNKVNLKTLSLLSGKNIVSSPKRTIFSSLVLFVQFFIISLLVITILGVDVSYSNSIIVDSDYWFNDPKINYIYPTENQNVDDYKNSYKNSRFYSNSCGFFDSKISLRRRLDIGDVDDGEFSYCIFNSYFIKPYLENENHEFIGGGPIENEDEIIISSSSNYPFERFLEYYVNLIIEPSFDSNIQINDYLTIDKPLKVKGFVEDNSRIIYVHENKLKEISEKYNEKYSELYFMRIFKKDGSHSLREILSTNINSSLNTDVRFYFTSEAKNNPVPIIDNIDFKDNTIYIDSSINVDDFYLKVFNHKYDLSKYQIDNTHKLRLYDTYYFYFPDEIYNDYKEMDSCYVCYNPSISDAEKMFSEFNKNLLHTETTTSEFYGEKVVYSGSFILSLVLTLVLSLVLLAVIAIGRVILRLIYGSKKNNYVIYKTIGFNERKIKIMDYIEMIAMSLFVYAIDIIAVYFIVMRQEEETTTRAFYNPLFYIITFIIVMFVAINFVRKFENKVFNKSIASTLKAGDYLD